MWPCLFRARYMQIEILPGTWNYQQLSEQALLRARIPYQMPKQRLLFKNNWHCSCSPSTFPSIFWSGRYIIVNPDLTNLVAFIYSHFLRHVKIEYIPCIVTI